MSGVLAAPSPRWFSIAPHRPFLDDLADGLWRELSPAGPEAVADAMVLLPNRRSMRALADAFVACTGGRAVLPPQIRPLGDLDEGEPPFEPGDLALDLPPAIGAHRRRFELAGLVAANAHLLDRRLDAAAALELADALAAFLDALQIEEVADVDLPAAVDGDFAGHWRKSADFLDLALTAWPKRLAELGLMDLAARRVALIRRLEARWRDAPPDQVIVAAGSTGSTPAVAGLLAAIAAAPRGLVVLPGLDASLAESAWKAARLDDQHPQGALARLFARARVERAGVRAWPGSEEAMDRTRWRRRVINEALRPAELTADWREVIGELKREAAGVDPIAEGLDGLELIRARNEEEAAAVAALLLRETLDAPERRAVLVTPDAALARRTAARLTRWGVTADSSVGRPLSLTPPGVLALLAARATADPTDPATLLGVVKHELARLGHEPGVLARARETLEGRALRGARARDWAALEARVERSPESVALARALAAALAPAQAAFVGGEAEVAQAARSLAETLEALAVGPQGEPGAPWNGQAGAALAAVLGRLMSESEALPPVTPGGFAQLLEGLMLREAIRPGGATHPRVEILGVLEARLVHADLVILGGLEEGVWPQAAPVDPFLSRPMRARLGLPSPERRIGLAAHDFAQAACAPQVVLLHTARRAGSPTVQSRWLWRLETLIRGADLTAADRPEALAWARALDAPLREPPPVLRTAERPRPSPPVSVRPRELPVTSVETWVRDPYAVYARRILGLRPLDPPDAAVDALARGVAVHRALERFATTFPDALPTDAEQMFEDMLLAALDEEGMPPARMVREAALARNLAPWIVAFERERRPGARLLIEQKGAITIAGPAGGFTLTAKADRIELRGGQADVVDFKTGRAPTDDQVLQGFSPQLTLTGAILEHAGFASAGAVAPRELVYVRVSGGREPGEVKPVTAGAAPDLAAAALKGLTKRIARFDEPGTPYVSRAATQYMGDAGDYDHLARVWEWAVIGEQEGES
jgi:ATP-dependent helicase/nuclease subunit B